MPVPFDKSEADIFTDMTSCMADRILAAARLDGMVLFDEGMSAQAADVAVQPDMLEADRVVNVSTSGPFRVEAEMVGNRVDRVTMEIKGEPFLQMRGPAFLEYYDLLERDLRRLAGEYRTGGENTQSNLVMDDIDYLHGKYTIGVMAPEANGDWDQAVVLDEGLFPKDAVSEVTTAN